LRTAESGLPILRLSSEIVELRLPIAERAPQSAIVNPEFAKSSIDNRQSKHPHSANPHSAILPFRHSAILQCARSSFSRMFTKL
jgi:hypothetical protein